MCAMPHFSPKHILVAGCGTGAEAFALQKQFPDAEVVGVDFSSRSILQAKALQKRVLRRSPIRLLVGDLTDRQFMSSLGSDFDFISCHGVLSYIPQPARGLRNISNCLGRDGALYLGVNNACHFSEKGRPILTTLGLDMRKLPAERQLRRILRLCDALGADSDAKMAKLPLNYLAGDLFGPLIHNLSLSRWVRLCHETGLSFAGHYHAFQKLRRAINDGVLDLLFPRGRAEVYKLIERLDPCGFHRLVLTKGSLFSPAWDKKQLLKSYPIFTRLYQVAPKTSRKLLLLKSSPINTLVEVDSAGWEHQFLRCSTGERTLAEILRELAQNVGWQTVCQRLYVFYQLAVINFRQP
jgi:SAM-dependent methyltransferase